MSAAREPAPLLCIAGKVMLSGEYAVLLGAAAALVPVPRWLKLRPASAAPQAGYPPALAAARTLPVPELEAEERELGVPHAAVDAGQFFSADLSGQTQKLGLGLSAAESVGMLALRFAAAGRDWTALRPRICELALTAHAAAQGGAGSGADVAACALGAPLLYRRPPGGEAEYAFVAASVLPAPVLADQNSAQAEAPAAPLSAGYLPALPLALLWTGQPANTRALVGQFDAWRTAAADMGRLAELSAAADAVAPLWFGGEAADLLAALARFDAALTACLNAAGVAYRLPLHARIESWARKHGGYAKPCGAGGGDMILLLGELPLAQLSGLVIPL